MKSVVILFALFACATAAPGLRIVSSPLVTAPLLTKVEGQAPASTVHAVHTKVVPQVVTYSLPAPIVHAAAPVVSAPVITAYSGLPVATPFVSHHSAYRIVY